LFQAKVQLAQHVVYAVAIDTATLQQKKGKSYMMKGKGND
jgi:hypothetical protein